MGTEPLEEEVPIDFGDFPFVVQQVIQIFTILPAVYEGMSGTYMGVNYSILPYLFEEVFQVDDKQLAMKLLLIIANIIMQQHTEKQKARDRKNKVTKGGIHIQG